MNKFASISANWKDGSKRNVYISSIKMAQIGIQMGWIIPASGLGTKIASSIGKGRAMVKVASGARKVKMNVSDWVKISMDNGWISYDPITKTAGFFSAIADLGASAANAVGNAYQGAKNLVSGAAQFVTDAAGKVYDAAGRAVNATVNAAGQVVDATGRVVGQATRAAQQYGRDLAHGAQIAGQAIGQGAQAVGQAVGQGAQAVGQGAQALGRNMIQAPMAAARFYIDNAGRVLDAAGRAVNATVNAAGQVVDATGKAIGQAANYVGQVAGQAANDFTNSWNARRQAGDTNFMAAGAEAIRSSPVGQAVNAAGQAVGYGLTQAQLGAQNAGRQMAMGYNQARQGGQQQQQQQQQMAQRPQQYPNYVEM